MSTDHHEIWSADRLFPMDNESGSLPVLPCRRQIGDRVGSGEVALRVSMILILLLGFVSCGSPFRVPERVRIPAGSFRERTHSAGLSLSAAMITDEDLMFELFWANLRLAGLLPVYLEMKNEGPATIALRGIEVEARDSTGRRLSRASPQHVLKQLHDYYGVRLYRPASKKELEERFKHIGFCFDHPLRPGQSREGFLFFELPKSQHLIDAIEVVTLRLRGIRSPQQGEIALELTLRSQPRQEK